LSRARLRDKFVFAIALLTLIITALVLAVGYWSVRQTIVNQTVSQGASIADTIASTAGYYVIFDLKDDLSNIITDVEKHREVEYAEFLSADGTPLATTRKTAIPPALKRLPLGAKPVNVSMSDADGGSIHLFSRPFYEQRDAPANAKPRGYFRLAVNDSAAEAARGRLLMASAIITIVALAIGIGLAIAGSRLIVRPILNVVSSATLISSGDLTQRTTVTGDDELGNLAGAFNSMAGNLEKTISKVVQSHTRLHAVGETVQSHSGVVSQRADEQREVLEEAYLAIDQLNSGVRKISENVEALSASSEETSSSILEMVASIEEVSRHTDSLFASVEDTASATTQMVRSISEVDQNVDFLQTFVTETSASMTEMSASITQVETNAARSSDLAQAVNEAAESGMRAVRETMEGMEQIRLSVREANDVVSRLGDRSTEIGKILNVIEDVAEQTNLLALNAAILAAQAGEYGKGFSVVAGEIRDLSERTASSTRDIGTLIRTVQQEVSNASDSMTAGSQAVERGVSLAQEAGRALTRILDSSMKSSEMGREIASATREQAKGSETVAHSVERVQEMVRQINAATRQQAAGSDHIMKAVESMREVTRYVRQAMVEQRSGSTMISKAAEQMIDMVHEIFEVTAGQAGESEKIVRIMERVRNIAEENRRSSSEMTDAIGDLNDSIRGLDEEVRRFRIRG
jgi:methyl-accepting chemotaxis protein